MPQRKPTSQRYKELLGLDGTTGEYTGDLSNDCRKLIEQALDKIRNKTDKQYEEELTQLAQKKLTRDRRKLEELAKRSCPDPSVDREISGGHVITNSDTALLELLGKAIDHPAVTEAVSELSPVPASELEVKHGLLDVRAPRSRSGHYLQTGLETTRRADGWQRPPISCSWP